MMQNNVMTIPPKSSFNFHVKFYEVDKTFIGTVEEFPSLSWIEDSESAALKGIMKLVDSVVTDLEPTEKN